MDLTLSSPSTNIVLHVKGKRADGGDAIFATAPTFVVESGKATLSPGPDSNSQVVSSESGASSVILVTANADLKGGSRILTAHLFLTVIPGGGIPSNEAVDILLFTDATNS